MQVNYTTKGLKEPTIKYFQNNHRLSEVNPMMSTQELEALKLSISANGQLEPITIFRGKVVDGRNRLLALHLLHIEEVITNVLSHNTSNEVLEYLVQAKENRRMQTKTQLAIKAYRDSVEYKISLTKASKQNSVSITDTRAARDLEAIKPLYIPALFQGNKIKLSTGKYSTSLQLILKDAKKEILADAKDRIQEPFEVKDRSDEWKKSVTDKIYKVLEELDPEKKEYFFNVVRFGKLDSE